MRIPVNMATPGVGLCPDCTELIVESGGVRLDVWIDGAWHADTTKPHEHQPEGAGN